MTASPKLSERLLRSSPFVVLEWREGAGRPLASGAPELRAWLGPRKGQASEPSCSLDELLAPEGKLLLDRYLARASRSPGSDGILRASRIPCSTAHIRKGRTVAVDQTWIDLVIEWTRDDSGSLSCAAVATDITELVGVELEAEIQGERYDLAVEGTGLGTWDYDPVSQTVTINHHWMGMLGEPFRERTVPVTEWSDRVHPEDLEQAYEDMRAHMEGETDFYENTHRLRHRAGHWVHILDRGRVVERSESGEVLRFCGTHTDISKQREAEMAALETTKAKGMFLATMSHEIRTPLHGILGMLQVLEGTVLSEQQIEATTLAAASGEHLLVLINDILEISKIEAGEFQLDPQPFALAPWLNSVSNLFKSRAEDKHLRFEVEANVPESTWILADDHRLRQIVSNLVSNAIKFTDRGSVRIEADLESDPLTMTVRVIDTGKGIQDTERVWNQFSQEDASVSRRYGGTGLGLALSRQLVELMGGTIRIDSEIGSGSTFTFRIPVQPAQPPTQAQAGSEKDEAAALGDLSVLVAEDNMVNRRVAASIFQRLGLEVQFAADGQEALEACRKTSFDLVLMDLHMPVMDGFEAASAIFSELGPGAPVVVALSADLTESARTRCTEIGFTGHLGKPFRVAELQEILQGIAISAG